MFVGLNFNSILLALLNLLIGGVLVTIIRTRVPLKKIANDREANLLQERAAEMELMRNRLTVLEAERVIDRHRLNNVTQCLDALLLLIEQDPAKAADAAAKIKAMRADQMAAEAVEKGAMLADRFRDGAR